MRISKKGMSIILILTLSVSLIILVHAENPSDPITVTVNNAGYTDKNNMRSVLPPGANADFSYGRDGSTITFQSMDDYNKFMSDYSDLNSGATFTPPKQVSDAGDGSGTSDLAWGYDNSGAGTSSC